MFPQHVGLGFGEDSRDASRTDLQRPRSVVRLGVWSLLGDERRKALTAQGRQFLATFREWGKPPVCKPKSANFEEFKETIMKRIAVVLALLATLAVGALAQEGAVPKGVPHLDHVFLIMMEHHGYRQILHNPNAPFTNQYAKSANLATNYFAVAHPSLTNYLEVVGGSNFGVHSDNAPDWHSMTCATNLSTGIPNTDNPPSPKICPASKARAYSVPNAAKA